MTIVLRNVKGAELTHAELDQNFIDLRDGVALAIPKAQGYGIKVDSTGTPTFGWHDLRTELKVDEDDVNKPVFATYRGGLKARQFVADLSNGFCEFHIPHDYVMGTDIFIHVHWSHTSALVTGGTVTWAFEMSYAKGHQQAALSVPVVASVIQTADTTQYMHMIAETAASVGGGSGTQLNTNDIEVDGLIITRIYLDSNDITVSGGGVPNPFVHFVDIHYQSTNMATKNRAPGFWD